MLSPAEVASHLVHDTKTIRDHALRSLAMAGDRSDIGADIPLAALERLGAAAFSNPILIAQLPISADVAQKAFATAAGEALTLNSIAGALLREVPTNLLLANRDLVKKLAAGDLRACLEHRLALAQQPHDKLWDQLLASTDRAATHDLILALIPHDTAIAPLIGSALARNVATAGELAIIELAGRIRLTTSVNPLADRLSRTEAGIADAAAVALGRLGTAGAATILEQRCNLASATPVFRANAAHAMSHFRIPSVESTLLRLVVEEDDQAALCALCAALADICTTSGFPRLKEIVASGRCGAQTAALQQPVSALDVMLKATTARTTATHHAPPPPPATPAPPAFLASTTSGGPIVSTLSASRFSTADVTDQNVGPASDELPLMEIPDDTPSAASTRSTPSAPTPLRRDADQVGRNDPCPCGSGKKYKKCCGA